MLTDGSAAAPTCPRGLLRRVVEKYAARDLAPVVGPELEFFLLERDPSAPGACAATSTSTRASTPSGRSLVGPCTLEQLRPARARREPRVHELAVRDQHRALRSARRRRPRFQKTAVKELAAPAGDGGDGEAVPGRVGLSPCISRSSRAARTRSTPRRGSGPCARASSPGCWSTPGADRAARADLNAYKRLVPTASRRRTNWGSTTAPPLRPRAERHGARSRIEVRGGDGSARVRHLAVAALLLAGFDGIERGLEPPRRRCRATPIAPTRQACRCPATSVCRWPRSRRTSSAPSSSARASSRRSWR